jgi:ABC-type enterochelin transport system ATPase subunit
MTKHIKLKEKHVEPRLLLWLQSGKTITSNEALTVFETNRISEYVARLRKKGHKIETKMVIENGSIFGRYSMPKEKKVSRIKSKEYLNVGIG